MTEITIIVPDELVRGLEARLREAVSVAVAAERNAAWEGFLDVAGAAAVLSSTTPAIRSLVNRARSRTTRPQVAGCSSIGLSSTRGSVAFDGSSRT